MDILNKAFLNLRTIKLRRFLGSLRVKLHLYGFEPQQVSVDGNEVVNQGQCLDIEKFEQVLWLGMFTNFEHRS